MSTKKHGLSAVMLMDESDVMGSFLNTELGWDSSWTRVALWMKRQVRLAGLDRTCTQKFEPRSLVVIRQKLKQKHSQK